MLRIATFGSCLSRYSANEYVRLFGGKIVSCVYHNRSDAFVHRFIERDWKVGDYDSIKKKLTTDGNYTVDSLPENILKNQFAHTMGKHRLSSGIPFLGAMTSIDLIIMDNYMDLSAKLVSSIEFEGIFLSLNNVSISHDHIKILDYLPPVNAINYMTKIINFFRLNYSNARIVFLNFPYNTYKNSSGRMNRAIEYESLFKYDGIDIIPALTVPELYQTKQKQHFSKAQYAAYAGIIYSLLNN